jgi:hypothetical protein
VVSFMPRPVYSQVRSASTHCLGGWVGPRASLDNVERRVGIAKLV